MSTALKCPERFLEVRISDLSQNPTLLTLCAGYEAGEWRAVPLANHLFEWLPEFCLKYSEIVNLGSHNAVRLLKQAARTFYSLEKNTDTRGEIGELLLHVAIRQDFHTIPFVSKMFFKDFSGYTVKGFDCVHILITRSPEGIEENELWLGEAKFYKDFDSALTEAIDSVETHLQHNYLRKEFLTICNKIDESHPQAKQIRKLLDVNRSLDTIFSRLVIPILITYESDTVKNFTTLCREYQNAIEEETKGLYAKFCKRFPEIKPTIHLILVPLKVKQSLVDAFNSELERQQ